MMRLSKVLLLAMVTVSVGVASAFAAGPSLTAIPLLDGTTNQGRAITPDGRFVGGVSGAQGFVYDSLTDTVTWALSSDGAGASEVTGAGYRTNPDTGGQQLVVSGKSAGWPTYWFGDGVSNDFGQLKKLRDTSVEMNMNVANTMRGTNSDQFFGTMWIRSNELAAYVERGFGGGDPPSKARTIKSSPSPQRMTTRGVSATGRAVGTRRDTDGGSANRRNMYLTYIDDVSSPAQTFFKGLDGSSNRGEAWSVSADGDRIFGISPKDVGSNDFYPYMYTVSTDTIEALPLAGDTGGSTLLGVPYGASDDGNWAVGQNYRGQERAALWNVSDANPTNWTVLDLTDWASGLGILGNFTLLTRGYSVGVNGDGNPVVTGFGIYDGDTRAFVLTVPEPATLTLLVLGLPLLLRRRRRS